MALCALGILLALYHDPEGDRARLRRALLGVVLVALVTLALTMTLGLSDAVVNPLPVLSI